MIIPSIDLMNGNAVQLVGGRELELDAGDPLPIAERFGLVGKLAVIDLDAALGQGSNADVIAQLCRAHECIVGGGIRSYDAARRALDAGAAKIILGTAATPDLLRRLPRERVVAALDALNGDVQVEGWRKPTGQSVEDKLVELRPYVSGFLVTMIEREGHLGGTAIERVPRLVELAGAARLTIAGGVRDATEVAMLDRLGADAQVGMALYKDELQLADAVAAVLQSDRADGLWPTVVCDERGVALGLCWSNRQSLRVALDERRGVYWSRTRGLWRKGETSGATQELLRVSVDCDRDALRFVVRQGGAGFCHEGTASCWGSASALSELEQALGERVRVEVGGSYTQKLLADPQLLRAKLLEEAEELADAEGKSNAVHEAADVLYFSLVALQRAGGSLADVERELTRRRRRVTRRPGAAKTGGAS